MTRRDLPYAHDLATRTQYVLVDSCGCPLGVMEGTEARDVDDARYEFADGQRGKLLDWRRRGVTVVHVSHEEYTARYYPLMLSRCPHGGAS